MPQGMVLPEVSKTALDGTSQRLEKIRSIVSLIRLVQNGQPYPKEDYRHPSGHYLQMLVPGKATL